MTHPTLDAICAHIKQECLNGHDLNYDEEYNTREGGEMLERFMQAFPDYYPNTTQGKMRAFHILYDVYRTDFVRLFISINRDARLRATLKRPLDQNYPTTFDIASYWQQRINGTST